MSDELKGITLNAKTGAYLLMLVSLFGAIWQGVGYAKSFETSVMTTNMRVDAINTWIVSHEKNSEKALAKLDAQGAAIGEIKVMLAELKIQLSNSNKG